MGCEPATEINWIELNSVSPYCCHGDKHRSRHRLPNTNTSDDIADVREIMNIIIKMWVFCSSLNWKLKYMDKQTLYLWSTKWDVHGTDVFRQRVPAWRRPSRLWRDVEVRTRTSCKTVTTDARCIPGWRRLSWSHLSLCDDVRRTWNPSQHLDWVQASLAWLGLRLLSQCIPSTQEHSVCKVKVK